MNSVHDMGGMHGLGPIAPDPAEPLFHADWEARVLALTLAVGAWGRWTLDRSRHQREKIPAADYLRMSYYEKWFTGLEQLVVDTKLVSKTELVSGTPDSGSEIQTPPLPAERVAGGIAAGGPTSRAITTPQSFGIGQSVRARNLNPTGHTRLPRYVRGHVGVVERDHGAHVFPDTNAHGLGEQPRRLYGVYFPASELWGEAAPWRGGVHLDLWDAYLESA